MRKITLKDGYTVVKRDLVLNINRNRRYEILRTDENGIDKRVCKHLQFNEVMPALKVLRNCDEKRVKNPVYVTAVTVGEMQKQAQDLKAFLTDNIMSMVLCGGLFADTFENCGVDFSDRLEKYTNQTYSQMIAEIDYADSLRERTELFVKYY